MIEHLIRIELPVSKLIEQAIQKLDEKLENKTKKYIIEKIDTDGINLIVTLKQGTKTIN